MTFNQEVKKELCRLESKKSCCEWAQLYAMLVFSRTFPGQETIFTTESKPVADHSAQHLAGITGTFATVRTDLRRLKEEAPRYSLCVEDKGQRELLAERFSLEYPSLVPAFWKKTAASGRFFGGFSSFTAR